MDAFFCLSFYNQTVHIPKFHVLPDISGRKTSPKDLLKLLSLGGNTHKTCFFVFPMSLYITSLNSGSNGNCYYIGNDEEAVLVDAGISCRETEKRMSRVGLCMSKVKAIFVSHEHTDHIRGIQVLAKKYQLPVYITSDTYVHGRLNLQSHLVFPFKAYQPVQIGRLAITAFPKHHDAAEPHSFVVDGNKIRVGVFTDIGAPCEHVVTHFKECHAAFLEANYDEELLANGRYPYYLKRRISGGKGHLSNTQALELFITHRPAYMSHLLLSHLSKDNNCPDLVHDLFSRHANETEIVVASRYQETSVYKIIGSRVEDSVTPFLNFDALIP